MVGEEGRGRRNSEKSLLENTSFRTEVGSQLGGRRDGDLNCAFSAFDQVSSVFCAWQRF